MNKNPKFVSKGTSEQDLYDFTQKEGINLLPILDENKKIIDIYLKGKLVFDSVPVMLMAGGLGVRLGELTKDCPKPMLKIGEKPILEIILDRFVNAGFNDFFISVNYKAEMIEDYFKDGKSHNCKIQYIKETKRLGTAGSISLLPDDLKGPIIVMNSDLLTQIDFKELIKYHRNSKSLITMSVREYDFQVPYGVVKVGEGLAQEIDEKPVHSFFVNAGVYVIDSSLKKFIPKDEYFDMPSLLKTLFKENIHPACFPIIENWIDIGKKEDLEHARKLFEK